MPKPAAPPKATAAATDKVRAALRSYKGMRPALVRAIKRANPHTDITERWLQSFNDRKDKEPRFSKVVELGRALGVDIEINATDGTPLVTREARP